MREFSEQKGQNPLSKLRFLVSHFFVTGSRLAQKNPRLAGSFAGREVVRARRCLTIDLVRR
jgi:hypothetical protein